MKNKLINSVKLFLYRASFWPPFSLIAKLLLKPFIAPLIPIKNGGGKKRDKPFYIIVTVDTESGYVANNEERLWQVNYPDLYQGFYFGIKNWLDLLKRQKAKASFMLSSQCFSATGNKRKLINQQLSKIISGNHELGYHLHPRSDRSLEKVIGEKLKFTSAKFYSVQEIDNLLKAARYLLNKNLGERINRQITSFRWGNFGLYPHAVNLLSKNGFTVDTSVCPGKKGHQFDDKIFDWSKITNPYPYPINQNSLLEIPITTLKVFNTVIPVDPVNHLFLEQAFLKYWQLNNASKQPFFFVILSHSCEATYKNGRPTPIIQTMRNFIKTVKQFDNVKFITLKQAEEIYRTQHDA